MYVLVSDGDPMQLEEGEHQGLLVAPSYELAKAAARAFNERFGESSTVLETTVTPHWEEAQRCGCDCIFLVVQSEPHVSCLRLTIDTCSRCHKQGWCKWGGKWVCLDCGW